MPRPPTKSDKPERPLESTGELGRWIAKVRLMGLREIWWSVLDAWDAKRSFRRAVCWTAGLALAGGGAAAWLYPKYKDKEAVGAARSLIAEGRLEAARAEVRRAIEAAPDRAETWIVAAEFERALGHFALAAARGRVAADLEPANRAILFAWAEDSLAAGQPAEARRALGRLTAAEAAASAEAQRLFGELAGEEKDYAGAREHYAAALRLDGTGPRNEVPLGRWLLRSAQEAEREDGRMLLAPYVADPEWGAMAARSLLTDAAARNDVAEALRLAKILRVHPKREAADIPACLRVLVEADPAGFATVLDGLKAEHSANAKVAQELVEWLNVIGQPAEAVRWAETLPERFAKSGGLEAARAESLRLAQDWTGLARRVEEGDWGARLDFMRRAYGLEAARRLGDEKQEARWRASLRDAVVNQGGPAFGAASRLFEWGAVEEASMLATQAADDPEVAEAALGLLARCDAAKKDAVALCRVLRRLHVLRPNDAAIADRLAYYSALTGQGTLAARTLARKNFETAPGNLEYRSTYGFVMVVQDDAAAAVDLLGDHAREGSSSTAFAFAYGLALNGIREKEAARAWLALIDLRTLMPPEVELVQRALGN